jgi:hypothetical protein
MEWLDKIIAVIPGQEWTFYPALLMVSQLIMARFPSAKPIGWFHMGSGILHKVSVLLEKVAQIIDRVFPQKLS